jgi:purine-binding chemotaxis protein CheW
MARRSEETKEALRRRFVLVVSQGRYYALPLENVAETMRPLPVDAVLGAPPFLQGLSIIRGNPTPVIDLAMLIEGRPTERASRFVTLRNPSGPVALAVEEVVGIREFADAELAELPAVLTEVSERIRGLGRLDGNLLIILETFRLLPEDLLGHLPDHREGA